MPRSEFKRGVSADLVGEKCNHLLALNGLRQGLWEVSSLGRWWEHNWGQGIAIQEHSRREARSVSTSAMVPCVCVKSEKSRWGDAILWTLKW